MRNAQVNRRAVITQAWGYVQKQVEEQGRWASGTRKGEADRGGGETQNPSAQQHEAIPVKEGRGIVMKYATAVSASSPTVNQKIEHPKPTATHQAQIPPLLFSTS